jgi:uncharacterized coiled-coil protein SlyX
MSSDLSARVEELESRISFHEDLLHSLDQSVVHLSTDNDKLRAELKQLRESLDDVWLTLENR